MALTFEVEKGIRMPKSLVQAEVVGPRRGAIQRAEAVISSLGRKKKSGHPKKGQVAGTAEKLVVHDHDADLRGVARGMLVRVIEEELEDLRADLRAVERLLTRARSAPGGGPEA